jgi:hypothetical protein
VRADSAHVSLTTFRRHVRWSLRRYAFVFARTVAMEERIRVSAHCDALPFTPEWQVLFGCFGYRNWTLKHISVSELSANPESMIDRVVADAFRVTESPGESVGTGSAGRLDMRPS